MKVYRENKLKILINIALAAILILIIVFINGYSNKVLVIMTCLVLVAYFVFQFFEKRYIKIKISDADLSIISSRFWIRKEENIIKIQNLTQSYKKEIGPRGLKIKVYRLYNQSKSTIIKIVPGYHGWSEKTIEEMIADLQKLGIKLIE